MNPKNYNQNNSSISQDSVVNGKITFENNNQFNGYKDIGQVYDQTPLSPEYTRQELNNVDIPAKIGKEIRAQKYRIFIIAFISFIMAVVGIFFIACAYGAKEDMVSQTKWLIPIKSVPKPGFMIALTIVGLVILALSLVSYFNLLTNIKSYKKDLLNGNSTVPYFLIKSYKSMIARVVYANWIALTLYLIEGIIIGVLWGVRSIHTPSVYHKFNTELIIMYCLAGATLFVHVLTLFTAHYRKNNLNSYFNTQIVSDEQAHEISHHANKICWVSFLVFIITISIVGILVYFLVKKRKKKPMLP